MGILLQILSVAALLLGTSQSPASSFIETYSVAPIIHTDVHTQQQHEPLLQIEPRFESDEEDNFSPDQFFTTNDALSIDFVQLTDQRWDTEPKIFNARYFLTGHLSRGPPAL